MPPPAVTPVFRQGLKLCRYCLGCCFCWALWLGLLALVAFQIHTATTKPMPVPAFLLRSLERQLARSEITARIGKTGFAPTGQILIEDLQLFLPHFAEPVAQIGSVYLQIDPWALLTRRLKVDTLRASDLALYIPALLSASGTREPLLENAELALHAHRHELELSQFSTRIGYLNGLAISVQGRIDTRPLVHPERQTETLLPVELFARYYPQLCRQLGELAQWAAGLSEARIDLSLTPSPSAGATAQLALTGSGYQSPKQAPIPFALGAFRATTTLPLHSTTPSPASLCIDLDSLDLPLHSLPVFAKNSLTRDTTDQVLANIRLVDLRTTLFGQIDTAGHLRFRTDTAQTNLRELRINQGADLIAQHLALRTEFHDWPILKATALLHIDGSPLNLSTSFDIETYDTILHANGEFPPKLLALISEWSRVDIGRFLALNTPPAIDLEAHFSQGQFPTLKGHFDAHDVFAYGVTLDRIGGDVLLAEGHFDAPATYAQIGTNHAQGSYHHNLATRDFRFLLDGQLDPTHISPWFRAWWGEFWEKFDFSQSPPTASVDVQGRWGQASHTHVFVYADAISPRINGASLDQVRTRIYAHPDYYDAMEVRVQRGTQFANGWFVRRNDPETKRLARQNFDFTSTLDMEHVAALSGSEVQTAVAPFHFAEALTLEAAGYVAANAERHFTLHGRTSGDFSLYAFPLNGLSFTATVEDDTLRVDSLSAGLAEGIVSGHLLLQGQGEAQTLGFDLSLAQGKFYHWTRILSEYLARRRGEEPPPSIEKNTNVTIDLDVSAEGSPRDALSFTGSGNMQLKGRGLGQIHLFGLLSELLSFTALNFNQLLTSFTIDHEKLIFPEVAITGSNSSITASGHYAMDGGGLDFRARVNPFGESKFILKTIVGLMLTPVSNVLEVRLTGPLDNPKWNFLHFSPTPNNRSNPPASENQAPLGGTALAPPEDDSSAVATPNEVDSEKPETQSL